MERDSLGDLAERLDVLEQVFLDLARVVARQNPTVKQNLLTILSESEDWYDEENQPEKARIVESFKDQIRLD